MGKTGQVGQEAGASVHSKVTVTHEEKTVSIPIAVFSAISVTIGAGMVAVPKTTMESGIPFGIAYNFLNLVLTIYSIHLLLESARVTGLYSMPRLAYNCFGYYSLYFVNFVQFIAFGVLPIAYFIIFAGILSSFLREIPGVEHGGWSFIGTQWFSVLILGAIIFPLVIKKQISELSIAGALLFVGVILFNMLLWVLKIDAKDKIDYKEGDSRFFYRFEFNQQLLSSLSTAFVAYGFQSGFFPIYNALESKNYIRGMKFSILAMGFSFLIYVCIMFSGLYAFGVKIEGDVLQNLAHVFSWESYVLRSIFLLIMVTHTPFTFFIGKESVLCIAVLVYSSFVKPEDPMEEPILENYQEDDKQSTVSRSTKDKKRRRSSARNSKLVSLRSMHRVNDTHNFSFSNVDATFSMALPFYKKSMKTIEFEGTEEDHELDNAPAHMLLPNSVYYPVTLILFGAVVGTACIISDVESVIKYIGSLGNSILNFLIPGICYFIIMRKYEREQTS